MKLKQQSAGVFLGWVAVEVETPAPLRMDLRLTPARTQTIREPETQWLRIRIITSRWNASARTKSQSGDYNYSGYLAFEEPSPIH